MYVSPISTRLVRGKSTPAIRAIALPLPLFVFLVRTNDAHDAATPHDLALVANPPHRRSNLHWAPTHSRLADITPASRRSGLAPYPAATTGRELDRPPAAA